MLSESGGASEPVRGWITWRWMWFIWVEWTLPTSLTVVRAWARCVVLECVCSGGFAHPCPFMPFSIIVILRSRIGWCFFTVVSSFSGGFLDKWRVMTSIEFVARLIGEALIGFADVRRFGGYIPRVTGARLVVGMGISIVLIQLARWSSEAGLSYVAEVISDAYRKELFSSFGVHLQRRR